MSHLNFGRWYKEHPGASHETSIESAGGFLYVVCATCAVAQHMEDVSAGNVVAPAKESE